MKQGPFPCVFLFCYFCRGYLPLFTEFLFPFLPLFFLYYQLFTASFLLLHPYILLFPTVLWIQIGWDPYHFVGSGSGSASRVCGSGFGRSGSVSLAVVFWIRIHRIHIVLGVPVRVSTEFVFFTSVYSVFCAELAKIPRNSAEFRVVYMRVYPCLQSTVWAWGCFCNSRRNLESGIWII